MKNTTHSISKTGFLMVIALLTATASVTSIAAKPTYMLEVLSINEGKTTEDALSYFTQVGTIIKKYGAYAERTFIVREGGNPDKPAEIARVWRFEDMSKLPKLFQDEGYQQFVPLRDSIFDLQDGRVNYIGQEVK